MNNIDTIENARPMFLVLKIPIFDEIKFIFVLFLSDSESVMSLYIKNESITNKNEMELRILSIEISGSIMMVENIAE